MKKTIMSIAVLTIAATVTGCASMMGGSKFDKASFGQEKKFAIVTISASDQIANQSGNQASLTSLVSSIAQDEEERNVSAQDLINASVDEILKETGESKSFKLVSAKNVLKNKAYRKLPSEPVTHKFGISSMTLVPAKGYMNYQPQDPGKEMAQLAKDLGVDGVIFVNVFYGYGFSGMNLAAVVSAGTHKPIINMSATAYGQNGQIIWQDVVRHAHDEGVSSSGGSANLKALRPHFESAVAMSMSELIERLDSKTRS